VSDPDARIDEHEIAGSAYAGLLPASPASSLRKFGGRRRGGADAVRYLSRRLMLLWPLALLLHVPGSMPLWQWLYRVVARNRYRIAGSCAEGSCRIP
jgi:predicted DCC family thiol-disulfide oxidoreductase YuxK